MTRKFPWQAPATRVDRVNVGRNLMKLAVAVMLAGLIVAAAIFPIAVSYTHLTLPTIYSV